MRITLGELRRIVRRAVLAEWAGAPPTKPMFNYTNNSLASAEANREQLGYLSDGPTDVQGDEDELPEHLREPAVTPEECFGPVPPDQPEPYVQQDPLTRDTSPLPTSPIRR